MKEYNVPNMEIHEFDCEEIVTLSGAGSGNEGGDVIIT